MPLGLGLGPCLCCDPCLNSDYIEAADNFNRADSSSLGANWVEDAGDWAIDSKRLVSPGANAIARWTDFAVTSSNYRLTAKFTGYTGDLVRVYFPYKDVNNAHFVEIEVAGAGSEIRGKSIISGVERLHRVATATVNSGETCTVQVCRFQSIREQDFTGAGGTTLDRGVVVSVNGARLYTYTAPNVTGTLVAAVGTGATATDVKFSLVRINESGTNPSQPCPLCTGCPWPVAADGNYGLDNGDVLVTAGAEMYLLPFFSAAVQCAWGASFTPPILSDCTGSGATWLMVGSEWETPAAVGSLYTIRAQVRSDNVYPLTSGRVAEWAASFDVTTPDELLSNGPYTLTRIAGTCGPSTITVEYIPL